MNQFTKAHAERHKRPGSEANPIQIDKETPDLASLPWDGRPSVYCRTPSGQLIKCYYSYADYCDD